MVEPSVKSSFMGKVYRDLVVVLAVMFLLAVLVTLVWTSANQKKELRKKTDKLEEICSLTKAALLLNKSLLSDPKTREQMLARFNGPYVGDGAQMLEWCLPEPFDTARFELCRANNDLPCMSRMFQDAADSIP